jgi:L-fuconolactonase
MVIDGHCHAWHRWPYGPPVPDPESRGSVEQLLFEMDSNEVEQAVVVAACIDSSHDNNAYVADAAARHRDRLHHFADIDSKWSPSYHLPGAAGRLAALAERYEIKGITHYFDDENDGWLRSAEGRAFFAVAAERRLILSLAVPPVWQQDLQAAARAFPAVPILCHHLGGARYWRGGAESALEMLLPAGSVPSIHVKVSGLNYGAERPWEYPHKEGLWIVRRLYEAFGAHRLCWGSDFPVSKRSGLSYRQALEIVRIHCDFFEDEDRDRVLGDTLGTLLASAGGGR